jgi:hypothetical protein
MFKLTSKRGNLSAPALHGISFPFLILENVTLARIIIAMMRFIIPQKTKHLEDGSAILIYKTRLVKNP